MASRHSVFRVYLGCTFKMMCLIYGRLGFFILRVVVGFRDAAVSRLILQSGSVVLFSGVVGGCSPTGHTLWQNHSQ